MNHNAIIHRYAATNVAVDRSRMFPKEIFHCGDRILVHANKNPDQGRVGDIFAVGDKFINVSFGDSFKEVDYKDLLLIPDVSSTKYEYDYDHDIDQTDVHGNPVPLDMNRVLYEFRRTAATAICQNYEDEMEVERLVDHFAQELRLDVLCRIEERKYLESSW
jgi:hypothetical protein